MWWTDSGRSAFLAATALFIAAVGLGSILNRERTSSAPASPRCTKRSC